MSILTSALYMQICVLRGQVCAQVRTIDALRLGIVPLPGRKMSVSPVVDDHFTTSGSVQKGERDFENAFTKQRLCFSPRFTPFKKVHSSPKQASKGKESG